MSEDTSVYPPDFPAVESWRVRGVKAEALTVDHKLAMRGNDGVTYAVPLFDLASNPVSGVISFRCAWGGGAMRSANRGDRIEVVRA
jgi:hypothetical protein